MGPRCAFPKTELLIAAGGWIGCALGPGLSRSPPLLWLGLAALGGTLRGRVGWSLVAIACGVIVAGSGEVPAPDSDRPADLIVEVREDWRTRPEGWWTRGQGIWVEQGGRVRAFPVPLQIDAPGPDLPGPGARLRLQGYLSRSAGYSNTVPTEGSVWRIRVKSRLLLEIVEPADAVWALGASLRRRLERGLQDRSSTAAALARALLFGDKEHLPESWRRGLRRWGLAHLTAVSGLHVALAVAPAWLLIPPTWGRSRLLTAGGIVVIYLALVGPRASVLRATAMLAFALLGRWSERPGGAARGLAWAVVLLLSRDPEVATEAGFGLSVSATAALILFAPRLAHRWSERGLPMLLTGPLSASSAAWIATLPWTVSTFGLIAPAAVGLNLVYIPWISLVLPALAAWTALAGVSPWCADRLEPLLTLLAAPAGWPAAWPASPGLSTLVSWPLGLTIGLAISLALWSWRPSWARGALVVSWLALAEIRMPAPPRLVMIDVGQGDAFLLDAPDARVLVDTGGWGVPGFADRVLLPALVGLGVRSLDGVVITHGDIDHCGGLAELGEWIPIRRIWSTRAVESAPCLQRVERRRETLEAGDRRQLGGWSFEVLHPRSSERWGDNDGSMVIVAEWAGTRVLLPGDVEAAAERRLVRRFGSGLRADVFKVAHHGSRSSSSSALLSAVRPRLALISAGVKNRYGHPSAQVLERLADRRVPVLRTDRDGIVIVELVGQGRLRITTPSAPR